MMALLGWFQLLGIIALGGILAGALVATVLFHVFEGELADTEPNERLKLLALLLLLPALTGALALGIVFSPPLLDLLGLARDHCLTHSGPDVFHICFIHTQPPAPSWLVITGLLAGMVWVGGSWIRTLAGMVRLHRRIQDLRGVGNVEGSGGFCRIGTLRPLAMTVGLLRPTVYVSAGLPEFLSDSQFRAVVSHEKAHAERLHSLLQLVARFCRPMHFGPTARSLLSEVELACEQVCDRVAAEAVGNDLPVAEAILAMERESAEAMEAGLSFGGSAVERRVKAIVESDWRAPNWGVILGMLLIVMALLLSHYSWLHYTIETWIGVIL